ncbi:hypothetical protein RO3G_17231 [Lichtheimia corymbifera JMRC:FSU:9682]|uniref:Uncharacterized protein n=1 Tax=Lichtheimia corymbifera JMRC:FSU:9682 TaxID=1263082 RepID=A0A068SA72_9FUNG|nr:hypothetical protein RO3G_17231 [Lichtheimia corymbifera JMRC:FSU:9682]
MTIEQETDGDCRDSDEFLTFHLPKDRLPGKDNFSKQVLKTQWVIDRVVGDLLDVPHGTYTSAETEWHDASRSDILYKPRFPMQKSLPPVLLELQHTVNESFMQRLLSYSLNALRIYNTYPIVLIICTDRVSPTQLMAKFNPVSGKPWMSSLLNTDFWAQACFIVSKSTLSAIAPSAHELSPLHALCSFMVEASPTIYAHPYAENETIRELYRIAMTISDTQIECDKDIAKVVEVICENNERMINRIENALNGVVGSSKAKTVIKRALDFNADAKRKYCQPYEDSNSDSSLEPLPKIKHRRKDTQGQKVDDLEFILEHRRNLVGKMNWNRCLSMAHQQGLCKSYSTGESLRRFFNNNNTKK